MAPELIEGEFVFCSFDSARYGDHAELAPLASMPEQEGLTLVIPAAQADEHGITYDTAFRCITLQVHSSLEAVGLTAAFSDKLTEHGLSANVIAGFYHDHIFIQSDVADHALAALRELAH